MERKNPFVPKELMWSSSQHNLHANQYEESQQKAASAHSSGGSSRKQNSFRGNTTNNITINANNANVSIKINDTHD